MSRRRSEFGPRREEVVEELNGYPANGTRRSIQDTPLGIESRILLDQTVDSWGGVSGKRRFTIANKAQDCTAKIQAIRCSGGATN